MAVTHYRVGNYRLVTSVDAGYKPGMWVIQKLYSKSQTWHDIGDPKLLGDAVAKIEQLARDD